MASAPSNNLPLFYNDLMPLNTRDHGTWRIKSVDTAEWLAGQHAIPVTVDEFIPAQRHYPIIFSAGENPVPLALLGLNEGINVFVDAKGRFNSDVYVPAYIRRYPFMLAKLKPDSDDMSLCFDPTSPVLGEYKQGDPLFEGDQPAEFVRNVMQFCEQFELAGQRTQSFVAELQQHDLLMDGEVSIQQAEAKEGAPPYVYRGFKMVNEQKLRELSADRLEAWNKNGLLPLIFAHLFSLDMMRMIFALQTAQGKGPGAGAEKAKKGKK